MSPRHPSRLSAGRFARRLTLLVAAVALVAAGCAADPVDPAASTAEPAASGPAPAGSTPAVTVPDAFTAIAVTPIGGPPLPFRGTDGLYHVAYDLQLTNATRIPATLDRVDVVNGEDPTEVIASFTGAQLVDPDCDFGDCNRLRSLPSGVTESPEIPPQESRVVFIDFTLDSPEQAPAVLMHRLSGTGAVSPAFGEPEPIDYLATPIAISTRPLPVIAPPVRGQNWVADGRLL